MASPGWDQSSGDFGIGGTDKAGYHHLLWEVVDNSVDEAINGYATKIEVIIDRDDIYLDSFACVFFDRCQSQVAHPIGDIHAGYFAMLQHFRAGVAGLNFFTQRRSGR